MMTGEKIRDSDIGEDLEELAFSLGYGWPDDDAGRWRVLKLMASRARHWRAQAAKHSTERLREVERQKLYAHQQRRLRAMTNKVGLRKAFVFLKGDPCVKQKPRHCHRATPSEWTWS